MAFTDDDREMLVRLDERMNNHLKHHEILEGRLFKVVVAVSICLLGIIGKAVVTWVF